MMGKTTHDEINLDLDGTIDAAIKKLTKLKKDYPKGRIRLTSDCEYGETYPRLKLEFTRPKKPIEIELEAWKEKQGRFAAHETAARAYAANGDPYPRADEMAALKEELGYFVPDRMGWLQIWDDNTIVMWDSMRGAQTRDGTWVARTFMADQFDAILKQAETEPQEPAK